MYPENKVMELITTSLDKKNGFSITHQDTQTKFVISPKQPNNLTMTFGGRLVDRVLTMANPALKQDIATHVFDHIVDETYRKSTQLTTNYVHLKLYIASDKEDNYSFTIMIIEEGVEKMSARLAEFYLTEAPKLKPLIDAYLKTIKNVNYS